MWAIINYYRDEQQDLEKYKLICKFVNPEAARQVWASADEVFEDSTASAADFLSEIRKHTKENLSDAELSDRILHPEDFDFDKIERVS